MKSFFFLDLGFLRTGSNCYCLWVLQKDHQAIDILLAEIDIYELFAFKHCKGRKTKLALCEGTFFFPSIFY